MRCSHQTGKLHISHSHCCSQAALQDKFVLQSLEQSTSVHKRLTVRSSRLSAYACT